MIEQITQLQGFGFENPVVLMAAIAGPALAYEELRRHEHNRAKVQAPRISNTEGLQQTIDTAPEQRVSRDTKTMLALGIVAIGALSFWKAGPTTEQTAPNPDAQVVVVEDHSSTMTRTTDMNDRMSRFDAITAAVNESLTNKPSNMKIGLVGFGEHVDANAPTKNTVLINKELYKPVTKQNGGDIVDAMDSAIAYFVPGKNVHNRIIIASDGTIDNTGTVDKSSLESKIKQAQKNGIDVEVIVPGNKGSTYKLNSYSEPVSSAINPEVFNAAGSGNIHIATSKATITSELKTALDHTATHKEKKPYKPAEWLVGASIIALAATVLSQASKRLAINRNSKSNR